MTAWYLLAIGLSFGLAVAATLLVRTFAYRRKIVDDPNQAPERKRHDRPTALLGGVAIVLSSQIAWLLLNHLGAFSVQPLPAKFFFGLSLAGLAIIIGGGLDDWRRLSPRAQFMWPLLAGLFVIMAGIGVDFITNPFGGVLFLNQFRWTILTWHGMPYHVTLWADLFTVVWILGTTYTTKILDGLDGLVTGLGVIGSIIIFLLTLRPEVAQPSVALLALVLAGACAGFLLFNWHPASIFLGESGSLYIGFMLGVLSTISGGKIATALLILGLPILDLAWVIAQRWLFQKTSPFKTADRRHLHFQLLEAGLSTRQSVVLLYGLTALFGVATLFFSGRQKVYALAGVLGVLILLTAWVSRRQRQRQQESRP
ncbi:MAG: undecaprenyl/decaprenyl-phosphate alpha-N-acetylglucosaminyl 1-phosphate transferase [Candidatus Kerfeldbacteria bacterium]|nr:undecaprenyl/decaprenyl-phosphate alpha-N-acetylglucosaminyl 1-phosphate transferase [Candidatus Kerfeldbacteria bacterium]